MEDMKRKRIELETKLQKLKDDIEIKGSSSESSSSEKDMNIDKPKEVSKFMIDFPEGFDEWSKEKRTSFMEVMMAKKDEKKKMKNFEKITLQNDKGEYFPEVSETLKFSEKLILKVIPQNSKFAFRTEAPLSKESKVLIDNMFQISMTNNNGFKVAILNGICNQISKLEQKPKNKFYVVIKGTKTGVFCSWPNTLEAISGYKSPLYCGFNDRHEALEYARKNLGINYHIDPSILPNAPVMTYTLDKPVLCKSCERLREQAVVTEEYTKSLLQEIDKLTENYEKLDDFSKQLEEDIKGLQEEYDLLQNNYDKLRRSIYDKPSPSDTIIERFDNRFNEMLILLETTVSAKIQKEFQIHLGNREPDVIEATSKKEDLSEILEGLEKQPDSRKL